MVYNFKHRREYIKGDKNIGKVEWVRLKFHEYVSMTLDKNTKGEVKVDIQKYIKDMIDEFPNKI